MSEDIPPVQYLSLAQDEFHPAPAIEPSVDHTALGDEEMTAFVAIISPEREEAFEVQMTEKQVALRKATQTTENSITVTGPVELTLLDLPPETLIHILLHMPFTSVVICQGVNRHLQVLISESAELQYYIHLGVYGMMDNPRCDLPISERLDRLLVKQRCWEELSPKFYRVIDAPVVAERKVANHSAGMFSVLYDGGVLRRIQIPSEVDQEVAWKEHTVPSVVTAGKRVLEQDLEIIVTAQPRTAYINTATPHTIHEVQVHFNQISTGEPHPDAQRIISFETRDEFDELLPTAECIGDNLVLVLQDDVAGRKPDDQVYVFGWKTGELKMTFSAPWNSYMFPLFLTTHTFLLPNTTTGELEYWEIPQCLSETIPDQPFFILSLPLLSSGNAFQWITTHAGPPLTFGLHAASRPFHTDPSYTIVCFSVSIEPINRARQVTDFAFFVHRSSLVGYLDTYSAFISSDGRPTPIPYDDWGPSGCRWFNESVDHYSIGWHGGTFGQRHAPRSSGQAPLILLNFNPVDVAKVLASEKHISKAKARGEGNQGVDKNGGRRDVEEHQEQQHIGNGKEMSLQLRQTSALGISPDVSTQGQEADSSSSEPRLPTRAIVQGLDPLNDPDGCFRNTVYSSLPYTVRSSQNICDFEDLYLDEEYVLGTQVGVDWRYIKQLHVLRYG